MHLPTGFATLTPYFFMDRADDFVAFLVNALDGTEVHRTLRPDGRLANAQVRFGTNTVMVSEASADFPAMPASYYLYVDDADAAMARALRAGASEVMAVGEMPYGERQGGARDGWGNLWWLSQRLAEGPYAP
jgi:PhnB protein